MATSGDVTLRARMHSADLRVDEVRTAKKPQQFASPTSWERAMGGLFASAAVGCVALIAIGGSQEESGFSIAAVAVFVIGPMAYGGLIFSIRQLWAFVSTFQHLRGHAVAVEGEVVQTAGKDSSPSTVPPLHSTSSAKPPSLAPKAAGSSALASTTALAAALKEGEEGEPSAWDLILEAWDSLPTLESSRRNLASAIDEAPRAATELPAGLRSFWLWLTRSRWKPYPWAYLPDPIAFVWGVIEVLLIAPIMGIEIIITVPVMELLKAEWRQKRFASLREALPEFVRSVSRPVGRWTMRDPRNHSYLPWMALCGTLTPALFFLALRRHSAYGLEFSTLVIYHILRVGPRLQLFAHIHTLAHKEGHAHRGFFRGPFRLLNCATEWWIGPFYGVVPWNYYVAHNKIHHRWHNDVDDVHTNLDLDRTNPLSFFLYVPRFTLYWTGLSPLALFIKRGEWALAVNLLYGMVAYYGVTALLFWYSPSFAMVYWVFPHMEACVLLCAISYLWHAFVEESDPGNQYVNSVTILDGHDNVWNEDYHVVHHHAPNTHWTEVPQHFEANKHHYAACTATIFRNTEEGMLLRWLFERNFDAMAEHFVDLNGKLTHEEKRALIVRRLSVVCGETGRDGKRVEWAGTSTIREFEE